MRVEPGQTLTLRLDLPADELRNLDHAWLKLALPVELPAGAKVLLNDLPLEIAAGQALLLVPLDSSRLKPTNQLQLVASEQPLAVDMLSVVLGKSDEK